MNRGNLNTKNKFPKSVVEVKDLKVQFQLKDKVCLLYTSDAADDP